MELEDAFVNVLFTSSIIFNNDEYTLSCSVRSWTLANIITVTNWAGSENRQSIYKFCPFLNEMKCNDFIVN